jgi:Domain of unknown function (DUF4136)
MKALCQLSIVFLLAAFGSALAQDVRYNFDKNTDFSKFRTYKWVSIKGAQQVNDIVDKQIKDAVDVELSKKGLNKVDGDTADLYVAYQAAVGQEKQFTSYSTDWRYGGGWYRGGWYGGGGGMSTTTGQTSTIYTGQLAIDLYDSGNQDLVWRGVVSKTIDPKAKPNKQQKNLAKSLAKLLKNYPPGAKS